MMTAIAIYLLIGAAFTLLLFPWDDHIQHKTTVSFLTVLLWPMVFYYAWKAMPSRKKGPWG